MIGEYIQYKGKNQEVKIEVKKRENKQIRLN